MPKLTDVLGKTNDRVTALENNNLDAAAGISRISKVYGNLRVSVAITATVLQYATPDDDLSLSADGSNTYINELNFLDS